MSREGPMAYAGGLPVSIAEPFGAVGYGNAVAGSDGKKYYVSMSDGTDYHLFVFDTQRKVWHREDGLQVTGWAYADDLYALTAGGDIVAVDPHHAAGTEETEVDWYVEFGDFTADSPNKKGIIKYQLSLYVASGADVTVKASYDGSAYNTVKTIGPGARRTEKIPIIPRRCDYYRLKIEGSGEAKIYALTQEQYLGSDD